MAKSPNLEEQRKSLEKLAKLKKQLAETDIFTETVQAEKLQKSINKVTESLIKMGIQYDRIDAFYEAFVKTNAQINEVATSLSGNLLNSINNLSNSSKEALDRFLTPVESLKIGAANISELLQNAIKTSANLETYSLEKRRENTKEFVDDNIKLTQDLSKAYNSLIKNEANLGTAKFQTLNVEKEIANTLLYIERLDKMKLQLAGGYYGQLRSQATTILEILNDIRVMHDVHSDNNQLAIDAIKSAKQQIEIEERLIALEKIRQNDLKKEEQLLQKKREDAKKFEEKLKKDKEKQYLTELKYNSKLLEDKQKKEKELLDNTTKYLDGIITKLPGSGLLSMTGKLGVMFQLISIAIGSILYLIFRWDSVTANIAEKLSITRDNATATAKAAGAFAANMSLANIKGEQVVNGLIALSEGFGGLDLASSFTAGNNAAKQLVASGALLTDTFGLSGQELAGMTDAATAMGMSLSSSTIMAVNMSRGIMSATKLMQSLASLSPKILTGFKGSNAELIGMVTKMKLLGVEANNIISSNDKLLDIESSITDAFEAQVATGTNINIDKLMALQLTGNYQDVINEQLRTLQQANYLNMSPLGQELLASGMGLTREAASQMMLRKILIDKVGLTDELIEKRQKEGQLLENDIKLAEKQGRITKLEADQLKKISEEYDNKTLQEKFLREVKEAITALSSSLKDLTDILRGLMNTMNFVTGGLTGKLYELGSVGTGIASTVAGVMLAGGTVALVGKGYNTVKNFGQMYKSLASSGYLGNSLAKVAGSGAGTSTGTSVAAASKFGKFGKFLGSTKGLGALSALGAGFDFYGNLQSGQSTSEAAIRAALTGGLGFLGALGGSALGSPIIGGVAGGSIGSMLGTGIGNLIYGNALSPEDAAAQADRIRAKQQELGITPLSTGGVNTVAATSSELLGAVTTMSAKLDTTNSLLNTMNAKPSEISVELDGEKVGKAVMNYSSGVIDRGRTVGNAYGGNRDQNATRVRK